MTDDQTDSLQRGGSDSGGHGKGSIPPPGFLAQGQTWSDGMEPLLAVPLSAIAAAASMAGVLCCSRRSERSWGRTVTSILVRRFGRHGIWSATTRSRQAMALKSITRRRCTSTRTRLCRRAPMSAAQPTISITRHFPCSLFLWSSEPTPGYARGLRWVRELMWATALCWDWVQLQRATSSRGECTQECRP